MDEAERVGLEATAMNPAPEYVLARRVLLDALQALGSQRDAVVLVGAQAIYLEAPSWRGQVAIRTPWDPALAVAMADSGRAVFEEHVLDTILSDLCKRSI